jgi:hypothetical protein
MYVTDNRDWHDRRDNNLRYDVGREKRCAFPPSSPNELWQILCSVLGVTELNIWFAHPIPE